MRALYGYNAELFIGHSAAEQAAMLRSWGVTAIFGGYEDIALVAALHAEGLKVYAEFNCFAHKTYWEQVPDSRPITAGGTPLEPEGWYHGTNPANPALRQHRHDALADLLRSYPVDGVWLDFIRWPCHWESLQPNRPQTSFDAPTITQFCRDMGITVPDTNPAHVILSEHKSAWTDWKCQQITTWVATARELVQRLRPSTTLGLFGVPWQATDFDDAIRSIIGQNFAALAAHIDVFSPMTYHLMCSRPATWITDVARTLQTQTGKPVCPIIQSVDEPAPLPSDDYGAALAATAEADGVIVFTLKGVIENDAKMARTINYFNALENATSH